MNFLKRGLLGITRKKGKSLILLAVIFVLGNLISGATAIQQATVNVETNIKERMGALATIQYDYEELDQLSEEEWMEIEWQNIGPDLIEQVGELSYVKYYDYNMTNYLGSNSIESYQGDVEEVVHHIGPSMDFYMKGINYAPVLDFEEGKGQLVDGRVFTEEEVKNGSSVAIISKKLADRNNLQVGDNFTLVNEVYFWDYETGEEEIVASRDVVLEIIGLFESLTLNEDMEMDDGFIDWMDLDYQNTIYVPNAIVINETEFYYEEYIKADKEYAESIAGEAIDYEYYEPMFVLNSPEDSEAFAEEVKPLLPQYYTVISATDQYDNIAGPVESMSNLSKYVLIAAAIATILIIGLVVLLFLRDRKRELGIYLSLGESRGKVIGQILIEVMVVAFVGITLSLFSGNMMAGSISESMMKVDDQDYYHDYMYYGFNNDITTEDVIDAYEVTFDSTYILVFYGIGLLTILLSTIIPLVYIVRLNPKKILME